MARLPAFGRILLTLMASLGALNSWAMPAAKAEIDLGTLPTGRPAVVSLWYPQGQCQGPGLCLHPDAVTDRTLVMSHGAMGAADNYQWLAQGLAQAGYLVVGINHFGESWFYGPERHEPQAVAKPWQRPQDISAIYDRLSNRSLFQRPVNWSNVIGLGHSSGGQTLAMLACVRFDLPAMLAFCRTPASEPDLACRYGLRGPSHAPSQLSRQFAADYRDPRLKKIILIDPTLGFGATADSLSQVRLPTLVVGAEHNDFLPWSHHGERYAQGIPGAQRHLLTGSEGHFVFLDACQHQEAVFGVSLCQDRPGVDRNQLHQALLPVLLAFVQQEDIPLDPPRAITERTASPITLPGWLEMIITYTPPWVFGLLVGLVLLGLMQVRQRQVAVKWVFIAPVCLLIMGLTGTLMDLGVSLFSLGPWLLAAAAVSLARRHHSQPIPFDPASGKLTLPGSWVPLLVILLIFSLRYLLGMLKGLQWPHLHNPQFITSLSAALGACSGYFLADILRYRQAFKRRNTH